jgi:hypothetical protein
MGERIFAPMVPFASEQRSYGSLRRQNAIATEAPPRTKTICKVWRKREVMVDVASTRRSGPRCLWRYFSCNIKKERNLLSKNTILCFAQRTGERVFH